MSPAGAAPDERHGSWIDVEPAQPVIAEDDVTFTGLVRLPLASRGPQEDLARCCSRSSAASGECR